MQSLSWRTWLLFRWIPLLVFFVLLSRCVEAECHRDCAMQTMGEDWESKCLTSPTTMGNNPVPVAIPDCSVVVCNRTQWILLSTCWADCDPTHRTSLFRSETDCWNMTSAPHCRGQLLGVASHFGYPRRSCAAMRALFPFTSSSPSWCPLSNVMGYCNEGSSCSTLDFFDGIPAAIQTRNPSNELFLSSTVAPISILQRNDIRTIVLRNDFAGTDDVVRQIAEYPHLQLVLIVSVPFSSLIQQYATRIIFVLKKVSIGGFIGGRALANIAASAAADRSEPFRIALVGTGLGLYDQATAVGINWALQDQVDPGVQFFVVSPENAEAQLKLLGVSGIIALNHSFATEVSVPYKIVLAVDETIDTAEMNDVASNISLVIRVTSNESVSRVMQGVVIDLEQQSGYVGSDVERDLGFAVCTACDHQPQLDEAFWRAHEMDRVPLTVDWYQAELVDEASRINRVGFASTYGCTLLAPRRYFLQPVSSENVFLDVALEDDTASAFGLVIRLGMRQCQLLLLPENRSDVPRPSSRQWFSVATDGNGTLVLSMGLSVSTNLPLNDIWVAKWSSTEVSLAWTSIGGGSDAPAARSQHYGLVEDDGSTFLLFGGVGADGHFLDAAVNRLDLMTGRWTPPPQPAGFGLVHATMVTVRLPSSSTIAGLTGSSWAIFVGGNTTNHTASGILVYSVEQDAFVSLPLPLHAAQMIQGRVRPCATIMRSGLLLIAGDTHMPQTLVVDLFASPLYVETIPDAPLAGPGGGTCFSHRWNDKVYLLNDSLAEGYAYWLPTPPSCTPFGDSALSKLGYSCALCPDGQHADQTGTACQECSLTDYNKRCPTVVSNWVIALIAILGVGVVGGILPLVVRGVASRRLVRAMERDEQLAVTLSECILTLEFDKLEFLSRLSQPNRLERAFLAILQQVVQYIQFMPMWVLTADRRECDIVDDQPADPTEGDPEAARRAAVRSIRRRRHDDRHDAAPQPFDVLSAISRFQDRLFFAWTVVIHVRLDLPITSHRMFDEEIIGRIAVLFAAVNDCADHFEGLMETVSQDAATISFNGLRLNGEAEMSAARASIAIQSLVAQKFPGMRLSCGIGRSLAMAGVIGQTQGRYTTVVGPAVRQAAYLSDLSKRYRDEGWHVLAWYSQLKMELGTRVVLRVVGQGVLPVTLERSLIAHVVGRKKDLRPQQVNSCAARNAIVEDVFKGNLASANEMFLRTPAMMAEDVAFVQSVLQTGEIPSLFSV